MDYARAIEVIAQDMLWHAWQEFEESGEDIALFWSTLTESQIEHIIEHVYRVLLPKSLESRVSREAVKTLDGIAIRRTRAGL